jgi:hypothetical protein
VVQGPFKESSFEGLGIEKDFVITDTTGRYAEAIAWTHRTAPGLDIYFISNQQNRQRTLNISLRLEGKVPELWDAVTGEIMIAKTWRIQNGRTILPIRLEADGSIFIVLKQATAMKSDDKGKNWAETKAIQTIKSDWMVSFDEKAGGPAKPVIFNTLTDWSKNQDSSIKYYSGTASYSNTFYWNGTYPNNKRIWLDIGRVANIAKVFVNGIDCGIVWTAPYKVDITKALRKEQNELRIEVTNTWANRIMGDQRLPEHKRITNTNAPFRLEGKPLLEAGLLGPVVLAVDKY